MVAKMTIKNQITIPKKILLGAGLVNVKQDERYFDVQLKGGAILLKPVILTVEDRIPPKHWEKFETWAVKVKKSDKVFSSAEEATQYLKKKLKKK